MRNDWKLSFENDHQNVSYIAIFSVHFHTLMIFSTIDFMCVNSSSFFKIIWLFSANFSKGRLSKRSMISSNSRLRLVSQWHTKSINSSPTHDRTLGSSSWWMFENNGITIRSRISSSYAPLQKKAHRLIFNSICQLILYLTDLCPWFCSALALHSCVFRHFPWWRNDSWNCTMIAATAVVWAQFSSPYRRSVA